MRIVLLGANGQLGAPILRRLLQDHPDAQVTGCVRAESMASTKGSPAYLQHLMPFNPFIDDWTKLGKVDVFINCIGIIKESATLNFTQAHMGLTALILQHRALIGNPKLIQISALGADRNSPSRFLRTKGLADSDLLRHPETVVVRPSIVCTHDTMLSRKLQLLKKLCRFTGGVLPFPERTLETKLQPVLVDDLAELVSRLCLLNDHDKVVEAGGRDVYTLKQLLEIVPACRKIIPVPQAFVDLLLPVVTRFFPALLDKEQQVLLQLDNVADTQECERILGREMASAGAFWHDELNTT